MPERMIFAPEQVLEHNFEWNGSARSPAVEPRFAVADKRPSQASDRTTLATLTRPNSLASLAKASLQPPRLPLHLQYRVPCDSWLSQGTHSLELSCCDPIAFRLCSLSISPATFAMMWLSTSVEGLLDYERLSHLNFTRPSLASGGSHTIR